MGRPRVDDAEIIRLHGFGLSAAQIAMRVGCTDRTVTRVRRRNELSAEMPPNAGRPVSAERLAWAAELFADGASRAEVRRTTGLQQDTIARHFPGTAWSPSETARWARTVTELNKIIEMHALHNPKGTK